MNSELEGADKCWRELVEGVGRVWGSFFEHFRKRVCLTFPPLFSLSCGLTSSPKFTRSWQFHFIHDTLTDYPNICSGGQVCPGPCLKHPLTASPLASVHPEFRPKLILEIGRSACQELRTGFHLARVTRRSWAASTVLGLHFSPFRIF